MIIVDRQNDTFALAVENTVFFKRSNYGEPSWGLTATCIQCPFLSVHARKMTCRYILVFLGLGSARAAGVTVAVSDPGVHTPHLWECAFNPAADKGITITSELGFLSSADAYFTSNRGAYRYRDDAVAVRNAIQSFASSWLVFVEFVAKVLDDWRVMILMTWLYAGRCGSHDGMQLV